MEFIRRNQGVWAVLAILSVLILVLFTFFGGAEEEEVAMRGKVEPRRMYLSFNMEYPIGAMYANVGDEVHRGDVLGVLQMDDLTSQAEAAKNSIAHYEEEMKDLRQEVLINLWKGYPQFKGTAQLSTWIYRVSLNTCITFCKKLRNKEESLPIESLLAGDVIDDNSKTEHLREMYRLIYQLNRMEKAIIMMWLDERSYEEIAEVCGMPRNTIATKLRRIKEKLTKLANE